MPARVKLLALGLTVAFLAVPTAGARSSAAKIAYVHGRSAQLIYVGSPLRRPIRLPRTGAPRWSGDGRLVSFGGYILTSRVHLPTDSLSWAPTGERAAYVTKAGGVRIWTPRGQRAVVPDGWGAAGVAWGSDGSLALGRAAQLWTWRDGSLRKLLERAGARAEPIGWHRGRVLWWSRGESSPADGLDLYEDHSRIATVLMYPDYLAVCGSHIAVTAGGDRYATHGKRILFDGRDVSRDTRRSWVSPSCTTGGTLVAAAGRNWQEHRFGEEHRAIWQLLPTRRQLTHPPAGWSDEYPHVTVNGDVVFVRTRQVPFLRDGEWWTTTHGKLELLRGRSLRDLRDLRLTGPQVGGDFLNYYGHYDWPSRLAYTP
jgi:hypothetical protein